MRWPVRVAFLALGSHSPVDRRSGKLLCNSTRVSCATYINIDAIEPRYIKRSTSSSSLKMIGKRLTTNTIFCHSDCFFVNKYFESNYYMTVFIRNRS